MPGASSSPLGGGLVGLVLGDIIGLILGSLRLPALIRWVGTAAILQGAL